MARWSSRTSPPTERWKTILETEFPTRVSACGFFLERLLQARAREDRHVGLLTFCVLSVLISQSSTYAIDSPTPVRVLALPLTVTWRMMSPPIFWAELWRSPHHHGQHKGHWVWLDGVTVGGYEAHHTHNKFHHFKVAAKRVSTWAPLGRFHQIGCFGQNPDQIVNVVVENCDFKSSVNFQNFVSLFIF